MTIHQKLWLLTFTILLGCGTAKELHKEVVNNTLVQNIIYTPTSQVQQISKSLSLDVKPYNPDLLNLNTYFFSRLDGKFMLDYSENQMIRYYLDKPSSDQPSQAAMAHTLQIQDYLANNDQIPDSLADKIILKIRDKDLGSDGLPNTNQSKWSLGVATNPYITDGKSLSLFRLKFTNDGMKNEVVRLDKIIVQNGMEQLYPFKKEELDDESSNKDKSENLHRLNLPESMLIPSGVTIIKFIAVPPVNRTEEVVVQYIVDDSTVEFPFNVKDESRRETTNFRQFTLDTKDFDLDHDRLYSVLVHKGVVTILKGSTIHVSTVDLAKPFSIYSIAGVGDGFAFGLVKNGKFSDLPKDEINITFQKTQAYRD